MNSLVAHTIILNLYYNKILVLFFVFLIGIHSMEGWTATAGHGVTRKRSIKRLKHTGNMFRKILKLKGVY